jgi:hypothetical protein
VCSVDAIVKTDDGLPTGNPIGGIAPVFRPLMPAAPGDPNAIDEAIVDAQDELSAAYFRDKYCRAVAYLAAHNLAIAYPAIAQGTAKTPSTGSGAPVTSKRTGDLAVSYGSSSAGSGVGGLGPKELGLAETPWGRRFLQIRKACRRSPRWLI